LEHPGRLVDEDRLETLRVIGLQSLDDEFERGIVHVGQGEPGQVEDEALRFELANGHFHSIRSFK